MSTSQYKFGLQDCVWDERTKRFGVVKRRRSKKTKFEVILQYYVEYSDDALPRHQWVSEYDIDAQF